MFRIMLYECHTNCHTLASPKIKNLKKEEKVEEPKNEYQSFPTVVTLQLICVLQIGSSQCSCYTPFNNSNRVSEIRL